jgi:hypothetical protein
MNHPFLVVSCSGAVHSSGTFSPFAVYLSQYNPFDLICPPGMMVISSRCVLVQNSVRISYTSNHLILLLIKYFPYSVHAIHTVYKVLVLCVIFAIWVLYVQIYVSELYIDLDFCNHFR